MIGSRLTSKWFLLLLLFCLLPISPSQAEKLRSLQSQSVNVYFDEALRPPAQQVVQMMPGVYAKLKRHLGFALRVPPEVFLVKGRDRFERMGGGAHSVAFALPRQNRIVIDYLSMITPLPALEKTLEHEVCHLLLHAHISRRRLPRWLDEGLCQWASEGASDLLIRQKQSVLVKAAVTGRFIPLDDLRAAFPKERDLLFLAYEQSRSFVDYLIRRMDQLELQQLLSDMAAGETLAEAMSARDPVALEDLEIQWQRSLTRTTTWLTYLSYHLYEILFGLMALITVAGFIKMIIRKRNYRDDDDDDDDDDLGR